MPMLPPIPVLRVSDPALALAPDRDRLGLDWTHRFDADARARRPDRPLGNRSTFFERKR